MSEPLTLEKAVAISRDLVPHVKGMTGGKAALTGEFPDVYVLDHLLAPYYGTESPAREVADFALASGVYIALMLARFWRGAGLEPFWQEGELTECAMGVEVPGADGSSAEVLMACPSDLHGFVVSLPNPFPCFVNAWSSLRPGDPILPKYVLGALLLSHPLSRAEAPPVPPGEGPMGPAFLQAMVESIAQSCARDLQPAADFERRLLEVLYEACLWPAVGSYGNDYGVENIRLLMQAVAHAGPENRESVLAALRAMERGWMAEGAYLSGLLLRAMMNREDPPEYRLGFTVPEARDVLAETSRLLKEQEKGA